MNRFKRYEKYKESGIEWLGDIPEHWEIKSLRHFVDYIKNGTSSTQVTESEFMVTRIETISDGIIDVNKIGFVEHFKGIESYRLDKGDILFSHINSLPMVGNCAIYELDIPLYHGMNLLRIKPKTIVYPKWLFYFMKSHFFREYVKSISKHAINQVSVPINKLKSLLLPYIPYVEQKVIANFLDQKTAEIDSLINDRERLIELLQEQRQAIITQVVTKGLDSNVPMKDSEVEWIGEIPKHWNTKKMGWVFDLIGSGTTPDSQRTEYYDGYIPWVNSGELKDCFIDDTNNKVTERAIQDHSMLRTYPKGSLIIALYGATIGKLGILNINATVNQACCVMSYPKKDIDVKFIFYWLLANREFLISQGYGGGQSNISQEIIKQLRIPFPSLAEQQAIAYFLDQKTTKIDLLISDIRTQISFLKEYRQSLITAAVTGKIDVRDYIVDNDKEEGEEQEEVS